MITRRFIVLEVYTADRRPHALNSEQRLRRAGRFSPTAIWPLPPLSQLEIEKKMAVPTSRREVLPRRGSVASKTTWGASARYSNYLKAMWNPNFNNFEINIRTFIWKKTNVKRSVHVKSICWFFLEWFYWYFHEISMFKKWSIAEIYLPTVRFLFN